MRRINALLLLLFTLGAVLAASPARATTDVCENADWGTEVQIVDDPAVPAYVGVEVNPGTTTTGASICFRDTTNPQVTGGFVHFAVHQEWNSVVVICGGDVPTTVRPNCWTWAYLNVVDPDSGSPGMGVEGFVDIVGVGTVGTPLTGAEAGSPTTMTAATGGHTNQAEVTNSCLWVLGRSLLPSCDATTVGAHAEVGDLVPTHTSGSTETVCVGLGISGGGCLGAWATVPTSPGSVTLGTDPDETAGVTVLGDGPRQDVPVTTVP